jgi:hypothetical protein
MTHDEWLKQWAVRYVQSARSWIADHEREIIELRQSEATATTVKDRDNYAKLLTTHEEMIEEIRIQHTSLQQRAKRRWSVDIPDLD